jgi:hypothetical protein
LMPSTTAVRQLQANILISPAVKAGLTRLSDFTTRFSYNTMSTRPFSRCRRPSPATYFLRKGSGGLKLLFSIWGITGAERPLIFADISLSSKGRMSAQRGQL